ncbi:MAG: hypothetical protein HRU26_10200 [Psychroserpens sp.]|nr:hypothetical protein [Psychroserpens sp.]
MKFIKLFNGKRSKLLDTKQFRKYLIYAIGEIILVVVGILIAIGINNWKTEKADLLELDRIIEVVESDLNKDLEETSFLLNQEEDSYDLLRKVLYEPKFKDSIRDCEPCKYLFLAGSVLKFHYKGHTLLKNFNKEVKVGNPKVDSIINFYDSYKRSYFEIQNDLIIDEVIANSRYLRDNHEWFTDYIGKGICNEACKDYFESPLYFNRLTFFEALYYDGYIPFIEDYNNDIEKLLEFLKTSSNEDI